MLVEIYKICTKKKTIFIDKRLGKYMQIHINRRFSYKEKI